MKKLAARLVRWAIPLAILAYLVHQVRSESGQLPLTLGVACWPALGLALAAVLFATLLAILRWWLLVRALQFDFRPHDALRLGFLGELMSFVALGPVGSDVVKCVFLTRRCPGRRARAAATVLADRVVGLYCLLLLATASLFLLRSLHPSAAMPLPEWFGPALLGFTLAGGLSVAILMSPWVPHESLASWVGRLPWAGPTAAELVRAADAYRRRPLALVGAAALSLAVHGVLAVSLFLIALALVPSPPNLGSHFTIMPLATASGVLPLPANGLGAFEFILESTYRSAREAAPIPGQGIVVAAGYRLVSLIVAGVGAGAYLAYRQDLSAALQQSETVGETTG